MQYWVQDSIVANLTPHTLNYTGIDKQWASAATSLMVEVGRMDNEATKLITLLIKYMRYTKDKYKEIQQQLVDVLLYEMTKKVVMEIADAAKFTI